jgi:hypothetical protein
MSSHYNQSTLNNETENSKYITKYNDSYTSNIFANSDYNIEFNAGYTKTLFGDNIGSIFNIRLLNILKNIMPDVFPKNKESNLIKLFYTIYDEIDIIIRTLNFMDLYKDIDSADSYMLDNIGNSFNVKRKINENDDDYRENIKVSIASNLSDGTINTFNNMMKFILKDTFKRIHEGWELTGNPAEIMVEISGDEEIYEDYFHILSIAEKIKPAGVGIVSFYIFENYSFVSYMDTLTTNEVTIDVYNKNYLDGSSTLDGSYALDGYGDLQ